MDHMATRTTAVQGGEQSKSFGIMIRTSKETTVACLPGDRSSPRGLPEDRGNSVWVSVKTMIKASSLGK